MPKSLFAPPENGPESKNQVMGVLWHSGPAGGNRTKNNIPNVRNVY